MRQNTHRNLNNKYDGDQTISAFYGIKCSCLDIHTMRYRVFGALWKWVDGKRYIIGYWFADNVNEILCRIQKAGFTSIINSKENEINEIYNLIRIQQDNENWSKRKMLQFLSIMKKPWKDLKRGWYVIKSGNKFPMIVTCIQKKRFSIWIEHIQICETEGDIKKFLNQINLEHHIHLIPEITTKNMRKDLMDIY